MDVKVVLSSDEILRGLKHYRRIAKQDLLRSAEEAAPDHPGTTTDDGADAAPSAEATRVHAEARREVYGELAEVARSGGPEAVVRAALEHYRALPFTNGTPDHAYADIKGRENALENFFLMVGLEPKLRREARSQRPPLDQLDAATERLRRERATADDASPETATTSGASGDAAGA